MPSSSWRQPQGEVRDSSEDDVYHRVVGEVRQREGVDHHGEGLNVVLRQQAALVDGLAGFFDEGG